MFFYQYTKTQIEKELDVDAQKGLSLKEARERFLKYGPNLLPETAREGWLSIFFRQFKSPLIYILVVCAGLVYYLGDRADSMIILVVLVFNAGIGAIQEGRSQNTLSSLKKLSESEATVIRNGLEEVILEKEVVPGDVLLLQEGQKITADARLIFTSNLSVDEAALTGESGAVEKTEKSISDSDLTPAAQKNMVFKGAAILSGNGLAIAVGTGINTEIGKISKTLLTSETEIPLQKNIRRLAKLIIYGIFALSALIFILGVYFSGRGAAEMFSVVVSLAVSMIPEGLPLVLTLILVTGVYRMSKKNALVKKMQAVEALGQANIIAVDKTGTITKNEMVVKKLFLGRKIYTVTGSGYEPKGMVELGGEPQSPKGDLEIAGKIASLASRGLAVYQEKEGIFKVSGDPTEAAMHVLGEKLGLSRGALHKTYQEITEIPFDYRNKYRAVFYGMPGDGVFCAVAGAPEALLEKATHFLEAGQSREFKDQARKLFGSALEEFSKEALRVVAFGFKHLNKSRAFDGSGKLTPGNVDNLTLAGFFGIEDSVRPESRQAILRAQAAGVKIVMITGDHKITAKAIAKEAGIFKEGDGVITGSELAALSAKELAQKLSTVSVFARVTPEDKMKIIEAYRHLGLIVAMTGDGVNDAPSLVAADLGVAMGRIGTEVAKEAADIVLMDDNLSSIVSAIEEGRNMYRNIQKALLFLFSTSLGEMLTIVLALILKLPLPVLAVQILWLNLITDPLIGMALALDNKEEGLLEKKFSKPPKYFMDKPMLFQMGLVAVVMAGVGLYLFNLHQAVNYSKAVTVSLTVLAVMQWFNGFNCHLLSGGSFFSRQVFKNGYLWLALIGNLALQLLAVYHPFFQKFLKTVALEARDWIYILALGFIIILAEEIRKATYNIAIKIKEKNLKPQAALKQEV